MQWEPRTHRNGRVALAVAGDGALLLGRPATRHLRLSTVGVEHRDLRWAETPTDEDGPDPTTVWSVPWADVLSLTLQALPSDQHRTPVLPLLVAVGSEVLGLGTGPDSSDALLTVRTRAEEYVAGCDGYVCQGYWRGDVAALQALMGLLLDTPAARATLAEPVALLALLAEVGEADVDVAQARALLLERWAQAR